MICDHNADTGELSTVVKEIKNCNNCMVDLQLKGQWTGDSLAQIAVLAKRFGKDAVIKEFEKE